MKLALNYLWSKAQTGLNRFKNEEHGGSEIIALVVVIGVVLIIAFIFKDAIGNLFVSLWNNFVVNGNKNTTQADAAGSYESAQPHFGKLRL